MTGAADPSKTPWHPQLVRTPDGAPTLAPESVREDARSFVVVDVRERAELTGPLGHLPGAAWIAMDALEGAAATLAGGPPVVVVSRRGGRAAAAALVLERAGVTEVAALSGGVAEWGARGFATSRDASTFTDGVPEGGAPKPAEREITAAEIEAHIGDPAALRWVKVAAFLMHNRTSCVDGRDTQGIVGTPGGDAGEFLLGLASVEALTGEAIAAPTVTRLLAGYLETFGRFYMHTDRHAFDRWIAALRAEPALAGALPADDDDIDAWRAWLGRPPKEHRARVLELLAQPGHIGCGHLRLMTENAGVYGIRDGLVATFLRAFFEADWNGEVDLDYVILVGDHAERAVLSVVLDQAIWPFTKVPLVPPAGDLQIFVNHPQVVDYLRGQVAGFLTLEPELGVRPEDHGRLVAKMRELAAQQLGATLERLAAGLPVFEARFDRAGGVTIARVG
ncbi:MAG: rhodanese-like domain-containing protein [Nannocystaceae bacterium]